MLWQVRAVVQDRPGAVAALAASLGSAGANILAIEVFPTGGGCVVDELVVSTPEGWRASDVEELCAESGVDCVLVRRAATRVLEDQPVRWLRAAQLLLAEPDRLEEQLCSLLAAACAAPADEAGLALTEGAGPAVRLTRDVPFTDTEVGRAAELRRLVASTSSARRVGSVGTGPAGSGPHGGQVPEPRRVLPPAVRPPGAARQRPRTAEVVVRPGRATDAEALVAMHARCSAEVLLRRYQAPVGRLTARDATSLLEPEQGRSLVVLEGDDLVGAGLVVREGDRLGLAFHVEDDRQRRGHGARLLRGLALEAAALGWEELTCVVQPGDAAVPATVRRAGLVALVSYVDGTCHYRIPLARLRDRDDPARGAAPTGWSHRDEVDDLMAHAARR